MSDFAVLAYLEWRTFVNGARGMLRSPARALLYGAAVAYVAFAGYLRSKGAGTGPNAAGLGEPYDTLLFCLALFTIAAGIYGACSGLVGAFGSPADARFIAGSALRERNVIAWLQVRHIQRVMGRTLFFILFYAALYRTGTVLGIALSILGIMLLSASFGIPVVKLQRRFGSFPAYAAAAALGACALVPAAFVGLGLLTPAAAGLSQWAVGLGLGGLTRALLAADARVLGLLYAALLATIAAAYFGSDDLYPELYALSERWVRRQARQRRSPFAGDLRYDPGAAQAVRTSPPGRVREGGPRGAWTLLWKDWIEFTRASAPKRAFALWTIGLAAGGAVAGVVVRRSPDPQAALTGIAGALLWTLVVVASFASAVALAGDLRKPMWWLCGDSLRRRLYVWTLATSWRTIVPVAAGVAGYALTAGDRALLYAGIAGIAVLVLFLRAVGLTLYAIFPSQTDQRGPVAMLRALVTWLAALPPAVLAVLAAVLWHAPQAGAALGGLLALAEAALLIEFAAVRIASNGVAFARAEAG